MNNTAEVENYPGFDSILGPDLAEKMYASSTQFGAEYTFAEVQDVIDQGKQKRSLPIAAIIRQRSSLLPVVLSIAI
ncbi:hypothetical protein Q757_05440 [Oenococcus alcoholitolerans]|uniref:Uncharacterized protein n=1 Tax=Oenococcus alcoholitolerans TaxID=931074 RepID=A0ABR4XQI7_9LACO|nr:hypothetical protein Q757_05440 [Oenococcus alcoholitolerans]